MTAPQVQTAAQAIALIDRMSKVLDERRKDAKTWRSYYEGDQPLKFATPEFQQHFGEQYAGFKDNWCAPPADILAEKQTFSGLFLPDEDKPGVGRYQRDADREFARICALNGFAAQSSQALTDCAITKRAFALVWGNDDDEDTPEITFEVSDQMVVAYEPGNRRKRRAALKVWDDDEAGVTRATLYLPDYIWKFRRRTNAGGAGVIWTPPGADVGNRWEAVPESVTGDDVWPLPNPLEVVPVVEYANRPRLRSEPLSEVEGAAAMQDAINVFWSYLFSAGDFAALPQRILLAAALPQLPVLDNDGKPTGAFKPVDPQEWMRAAARNRLLSVPGQHASVAQWDAADLEAITKVIEFAVGHVAAQLRVPVHYFVTGRIANIAGDGLVALAQAHVAKVTERCVYHADSIRETAALSYLVKNQPDLAAAVRLAKVVWEPFETPSPGVQGDRALKGHQAGMSRRWVAAQFINDPVELEDEVARQAEDAEAAAALSDFAPRPDTAPPD